MTVDSSSGFTPLTFELLEGIRANPTVHYYQARHEAFKQFVEQPLQRLMFRTAERLPDLMRSRLELRRNLFSRFIKNDFGRGGAWSSYWGAFYPKGSRRLADVQLALWMNSTRFQISFYIGDYGKPVRERFQRNLQKYEAHLPVLLHHLMTNPRIILTHDGTRVDESGQIVAVHPLTWGEWLDDPQQADYWVHIPLTPPEVLAASQEQLVQLASQALADYFPLALLAMDEEPLALIQSYLGIEG